MKRKVIILVLLIILFLSQVGYLNAQDQEGVFSFVSGNQYIEFSELGKKMYVAGMIDILYLTFWTLNPEKYQEYIKEMKNMPLLQITKIFDKYLEDHPEELHNAAGGSFLSALNEMIYE